MKNAFLIPLPLLLATASPASADDWSWIPAAQAEYAAALCRVRTLETSDWPGFVADAEAQRAITNQQVLMHYQGGGGYIPPWDVFPPTTGIVAPPVPR